MKHWTAPVLENGLIQPHFHADSNSSLVSQSTTSFSTWKIRVAYPSQSQIARQIKWKANSKPCRNRWEKKSKIITREKSSTFRLLLSNHQNLQVLYLPSSPPRGLLLQCREHLGNVLAYTPPGPLQVFSEQRDEFGLKQPNLKKKAPHPPFNQNMAKLSDWKWLRNYVTHNGLSISIHNMSWSGVNKLTLIWTQDFQSCIWLAKPKFCIGEVQCFIQDLNKKSTTLNSIKKLLY